MSAEPQDNIQAVPSDALTTQTIQPTGATPTAQPSDTPTTQPSDTQTVQPTVPTQTVQPPQEFYNLAEAIKAIAKNYERDFPKLSFNTPPQITDGCIVEFIDTSLNTVVATARVRVRNRLVVNNDNGDMFMQIHLSDIAYSRTSISVTAK